jgi:hypothetical protein
MAGGSAPVDIQLGRIHQVRSRRCATAHQRDRVDVAGMLGDADVDGAFRSVELRPRLEQIER